MSLSKKQKLKVLSKDPHFSQRLAYIEKLSLQLYKITGECKHTLRTDGSIAWSLTIDQCAGCRDGHNFYLSLKLCAHCIIAIPTARILQYKRKCSSTEYIITKFYYSAARHLDAICGAIEQAIMEAHGEKADFIYRANNPEAPIELPTDRFESLEL